MIRFSLFGFPIAIHWMFWLTVVLVSGKIDAGTPEAIRGLLIWVAAASVSIIIHELGHTFTMRKFGARAEILLYAFGGLAIPSRGFRRGQQIMVSLAGPAVEIAFGIGAYLLLQFSLGAHSFNEVRGALYLGQHGYVDMFLWDFAVVSVIWGLLNLVPIFPLDGGHVLYHALGSYYERLTFSVSIAFAAGLGIWFATQHQFFNALLFGMLAFENWKRLQGARPPSFLSPPR